jgi:hypothetical protein
MLFYFVWIDFVSPLQLRGRRPTRPIQRRLTASRPACGGDCQYIAASYVKYIESAGARAVPISYNANQSHLDFLFASLDGFLFPGGHFPETAQLRPHRGRCKRPPRILPALSRLLCAASMLEPPPCAAVGGRIAC